EVPHRAECSTPEGSGVSRIVRALTHEAHEAINVPDSKANLNLGTDSEHVSLPEVDLLATLIDRAGVSHGDLHALDSTPHRRRPLASHANNVTERGIAGLVDRAGQN